MNAERTTADAEGPAWHAAADGWAEHWAGFAAPAREAVAQAAGLTAGTAVLDAGCGSGEFCALAASRGARVSGIDAAPGLVEIARRAVPSAEIRTGPIERLPWPDASFDLVTAFNALQFAADVGVALAELRRVAGTGAQVAVCNWGRVEDSEMEAVFRPLAELKAPRDRPAPRVREPGVLEDVGRQAGLTVRSAAEVDVPYAFPDRAALERALRALAPAYGVGPETSEPVVAATVETAASPYRRADGSYRFENTYRYVVFAVTA
ncbi:MAG: class I SAM-dependent methyltransferase [Streptosporangiales bacterium]|nr:class I SAM-dependent methyltransferase [Streptosporangiales bacterium]MBO0891499.1 class I SAM-dependent methyltransferase [Acidothermales bacterium]